MRRVVEEFRASGLTRREFCSQRGIALTTFDYWRQAAPLQAATGESGSGAATAAAAQSFTLRLANGRSIESSWRFDEEELARLIRIAERV